MVWLLFGFKRLQTGFGPFEWGRFSHFKSKFGRLRDYAHKEWNGLLRDFYYNRWKVWIDRQKAQLNGAPVKAIDFYAIEEPWTKQTNPYSSQAEGDVIEVAKEVYAKITE